MRTTPFRVVLVMMGALLALVMAVPAQAQGNPRDPSPIKPDYPPRALPRAIAPRAAPLNDNFADAAALSTTLPATLTIVDFEGATQELNEPQPPCRARDVQTVWFSYTPPANQTVTIDLRRSTPDLDTLMAVYTGASLDSLTAVACNDDFDKEVVLSPYLKGVSLTSGTTYYIQVALLLNADIESGAFITVDLSITPSPISVTVVPDIDTQDAAPGDGICADSNGQCSLRAALMEANQALAGSVITLPAGSYPMLIANDLDDTASYDGDFDIRETMTLVGAGPHLTTVSADGSDGVFHVLGNATVTLSGMTITGGVRGYGGGGVRVDDPSTTLTLDNVVIINNVASDGAGLYSSGASITLTNSSISSNIVPASAFGNGGGIALYDLQIGDGVYDGATLSALNVTLSGNTATEGGGLYVQTESAASLSHVTLANNRAFSRGGGFRSDGSLSIGRSLTATNTADVSGPDCSGGYTRAARNLIGNTAGCSVAANETVNVDALLRPLELKGPGYTYTHGLRPGSPAIDLVGCGSAAFDQRGVARPPSGTACDAGALEVNPAVAAAFSLISPADAVEAPAVSDIAPFTWSESSSDVYGYNFILISLSGTPTEVFNTLVRHEQHCTGGVCTYTPPAHMVLADGFYHWRVEASYDGAATVSETRGFRIDPFAVGGQTNLIRNPGFEAGRDPWKVVNGSKDNVACNIPAGSAEGACVFRFRGSSTEKAVLRQNVPLSSLPTLTKGDTFRFSFAYKAGMQRKLNVRLVINYVNKRVKPSVLIFGLANTGGSFAYRQGQLTLKRAAIASIVVRARNNNLKGVVLLDDFRLYHIPVNPTP